MTERHPVRGGVSGLLMGFGFAILSVIYGLVRVEGPFVLIAIVLVFAVIGVAGAMFWPAEGSAVPD